MSESSSSVWKFFKKANDDGSTCQICMRTVKNKGGNTSNFAMHLRRNHPMQYATINPKRKTNPQALKETGETAGFPSLSQQTIKSTFHKTTPFESSNQRYQDITDAITQFLCKDNVAFNAVSRPGFQNLISVLEPRYKIPDKTTFSKNKVIKLYDSTRESVMEELSSIGFFSSTTDMWSSHGLLPYMGYTIHWIDSDWNLKSRNLGTRYVPENHTADNLAESMNDILSYWKLDETKQVVMTTDNGANVKKACKDNSWTNVSCFGHNLHLAITDTLANESRVH